MISTAVEFSVSIIIIDEIINTVFFIFVFFQIEHRYDRDISQKIVNTVNSIIIINSRSRIFTFDERDIRLIFFVEFNQFSFDWTLKSDSFVNVVRVFHAIIVQYRFIRIYFNFLLIIEDNFIDNNDFVLNKFKNRSFSTIKQKSIFSSVDRVAISFLSFTSRRLNSSFIFSNAFKNDKFNDLKKSFVRLLITSNFSFIINNRQISTKQRFFAVDTRWINLSNEAFFIDVIFTNSFRSTKEILRIIMSNQFFSAFAEINSIFWNDLLIMTQIFNIVRFSTTNSNFNIVDTTVDVDKSIVELSKNIEYFDSNYEDSFEKNFFIIIFDKHIFYRDVFIFIDRLKNVKKNFSRFKIKKYIVDCLKNIAFK